MRPRIRISTTTGRRGLVWWLVLAVVLAACGDGTVVRSSDRQPDNGAIPAEELQMTDEEWWASQDIVVAPWAHELDDDRIMDATVEPDRLIFARAGNEDLLEVTRGDILYAKSVEFPEANISRRVLSVQETGDAIVFETRIAKLDEIYLKFADAGAGTQQPLSPASAGAASQGRTSQPLHPEDRDYQTRRAALIYESEEGKTIDASHDFSLCVDEHGASECRGEYKGEIKITPRARIVVERFKLGVQIDPPSRDACQCFGRWYGYQRYYEDTTTWLEQIHLHCGEDEDGDDQEPFHWSFGETEPGYWRALTGAKEMCTGDPAYFELAVKSRVRVSMEAEVSFSQEFDLAKTTFAERDFAFGATVPVGPLVLVIGPQVALKGELGISGSISMAWQGDNAPSAMLASDFGIKWTREAGIQGTFTADEGSFEPFQIGAPTITAQAGLTAKLYGEGKVGTKLYDSVGPTLGAQPYLDLSATVTGHSSTNNLTCEVGGKVGLELTAGGEAGIPYTDLSASFDNVLIDTCNSNRNALLNESKLGSSVVNWLVSNLCYELPTRDYCGHNFGNEPATWVKITGESGTNGRDDPTGTVEIDQLMLNDCDSSGTCEHFPVEIIADGEPIDRASVLENSLLTEYCSADMQGDGTTKTNAWAAHAVSFQDELLARFDREIKPGQDRLYVDRGETADRVCMGSGHNLKVMLGKDRYSFNETYPATIFDQATGGTSDAYIRVVSCSNWSGGSTACWD